MHCNRVLSICLCVLFGIAADAAFHRRQDVLTTSSLQNAQPTKQTTGSISTATGPSDTDSPSISVTASTTMIDIHTDISNPQPTLEPTQPSTVNGTLDVNALPIQPTITPSIGITGVVMMITGLAYNIIGIKNQWLHVFLSAAFLSSLSVTVLIEYVMSPPVSNAIQGAYFVAAFLTGLIFGALSLIFKELTEGLGCLLGGFCVSMWLLSLKRGGLLADPETRGAFIGAFCVAFYALSFSSYTRPYGLIVSTAFAGSSIAVLGIDCFSRAGWKEFWLYIWGLNDNLFPFGTSTYPVTRGIRVELAVTVVVCLLGLLSQFKLWKMIRERRKKQEETLAEERRKKDEAEVELGRTIEEKKENDLVRWEAIYGDNGNPTRTQTLAVETHPQPAPVDLVEAPDNSVEMVDLPATPHDIPDDKFIVQDENENSDNAEKKATANQDKIEASQNLNADSACANDEPKAEDQDEAIVLSAPYPPPVTSLPFRVPNPGSRPATSDGDAHSIQVIIDDIDTASISTSKRLSAVSLLRRLSERKSATKRRSRLQSESDEMLVPIPPASSTYSDVAIEDSEDGSNMEDAKSVDIDGLELPDADRSDNESDDKTLQEAACSTETAVISPPLPVTEEATDPVDAKSSGGRLESQTGKVTSTKDTTSTNGREYTGSRVMIDKRRHTVDGTTSVLSKVKVRPLVQMTDSTSKPTQVNTREEKAEQFVAALSIPKSKSSSSKKEDLTSDIVKKIPSHVSPVVMSYRTNEWAKHLSHADAPEPEPLENLADTERPISPELIEVAAPLNVEQLKQTALAASPPPVIEKSVLPPPEEVVYNIAERSTSRFSEQSARVVSPRQAVYERQINVMTPPTTFPPEVLTSESTLTLPIANRSPAKIIPNGLRSVSSPLLSTAAAQHSPQNPARNSTHGQGTLEESYSLMAQRERQIQARFSSVSLTQDVWAPRNKSRQSLEEGYRSRPNSQLSMVEEDDMPLTRRRALLQQRAISPISPILGLDTDARKSPVDTPPLIGARLSRESRELSKPKVSTMAAWRESLQEDLSKHKPLLDVDHAQTELMEQQRKAQIARHQRLQASENLHNSIAERMRRGDMQDLHREAMRRMQAAANRKVNSP